MDFDYTNETITPDATNVLTIGGTGGLEVPFGTTAQRPISPANGLIRYNTDTGQLEGYYDNFWASSTVTIANELLVQKNPGAGQFSSIAAAVSSITTASSTNPWRIKIGAGDYTEPQIDIPPFVYVTGINEYDVTVFPDSPTHHVFTIAGNATLSFVQIENSGTGYAGVYVEDCGDYALCHKVSLSNCDIGFWAKSNSVDSVLYLEYCDTTDGTIGMRVESTAGKKMFVNSENWYVLTSGTTAPTYGHYVTGAGADVHLLSYGILAPGSTNGHGIHIQDGALFNAVAGIITGWDIGVDMPNTGAATSAFFNGIDISGTNSLDLNIQHPGATGSFNGSINRLKTSVITGAAFSLLFLDIGSDNGTVSNGPLFLGEDFNSLTDVTDLIQQASPMGLLSGGSISVAASPATVTVSSGYGYLVDSTTQRLKKIEWPTTNVALVDNSPNTVWIDTNGVFHVGTSDPDVYSNIIFGGALSFSGSVEFIARTPFKANTISSHIDSYLRNVFGPIFYSGSMVMENATTPFSLDVTSGSYYYSTIQFNPTGGTGISFLEVQPDGSFTTVTTVNHTSYNNSGTLTSLTAGYYAKHSLYLFEDGTDEKYALVLSQAEYQTIQEAEGGSLPIPPSYFVAPVVIIATIIVQQGASAISEILDNRPRLGFTSATLATTADHGNLIGLLDDDHTQYLLVNGTRAMSGQLDMGSYNIVNIGTANGVTIQAHGSRHGANAADPVPTGAPSAALTPSSTNAAGIANTLARSDHSHQITGFQPLDATLTALAAYNTNGILTQTAADTFTGRTVTGTTNRISVTNGNGVSGNPTVDIDSAYAGQTSITTLGTISIGTWNGTTIAIANGGTGQTTASGAINALVPTQTGNAGKVLVTDGTVVSWGTSAASVTSVSVVSANGFAGTVATPTTTPAITLSTTVTGLIKGNGTSLSAATAGTDYSAGTSSLATGILKSTTGTGALSIAVAADFPILNQNTTGTASNVTGVVAVANGGTGLTALGTSNQVLGVNNAGTAAEYKTISAGTAISVTNAANSITIANTGVTSISAGTGISVSGATGAVSITNTGVTSVGVSGGTTGLTTTGGPITTSGTISLTGTLLATNGGTGLSTYAVGDLLYASSTTALSRLADVATGNALISGGTSTAPSWGKIGLTTHVTGTLATTNGGTGLASIGSANQILGVNSGATGLEYKTVTAGTGISVTNAAGSITVANTGVTSVSLALPSFITVSGSPVTTTGTLTGTLATQSANTIFAGPATGAAAAPTFRTISLAQNDLSDVVITSPASNQILTYNSGTSKWVNSGTIGANAAGLIGVGQSGAAAWTLLSGNKYYADFAHNLGTTNVVITLFNTSDNSVIIADSIVLTNTNTVRVTVIGNTRTIKVVVVANGQSIVAGGSTPSSVVTALSGVTVNTTATKLNFTGQAVNVTDGGSNTSNISIGSRFTFFANSLDSPNNSDYAVNALAPVTTDPTYASLNVRTFSNTVEQGVACLVSIPTGATTLTVKIRGHAQTAPGVASVVQPRLYYRLLPNNSAVGTWSTAQELANISIPTNANFQYGQQVIALSTLGLTAGNLYQFEITRRVSGVTGTNLAANFLVAEITLEFA